MELDSSSLNGVQVISVMADRIDSAGAIRFKDAVRAVVDDAIAGGDVKPDDIKGSLQMMLDGMAEQDEAWEKHVAQASQTSSKEEFEQLLAHANGRMEAQRRLTQLKVICDAR